ncbi:MAG TPA: hypothetical protein VK146_08890, partial [Tabrizicola sp.]|nr:hypothetical protein [Tabrizicola sp.]
ISAASQLSRFEIEGVEALDPAALRSWGKPGAEAIATLEARAKEPGQEALAEALTGESGASDVLRSALIAELSALMPVQPSTATGTRDMVLQASEDYHLQDWLSVCKSRLENGRPGCVMVVADLLPLHPGEETMLFLQRGPDYVEITGLYLDDAGMLVWRTATQPDGTFLSSDKASRLLRQYQDVPAPLTAAELNQIGTGQDGLLFLP